MALGTTSSETFPTQVGNVTSYDDFAVTNGQTYYYKITAVNSIGESVSSNEASVTPIAVPQSPTSLSATLKMPSQINLSWSHHYQKELSQITGYMIDSSIVN